MQFSELEYITQGGLSIMNPVSREMIVSTAFAAGLTPDSCVFDIGCGNGTILEILGSEFRVSGYGIDFVSESCKKAEKLLFNAGLSEKIKIVCGDAAGWIPQKGLADCTLCIGASHIWGGFEPALYALQDITKSGGKIIIGDRYWRHEMVQPEFACKWSGVQSEYEILQIIRESGGELSYIKRACEADWDTYESSIWCSCLEWAKQNPNHPDFEQVFEYFHNIQDEYLVYGRENMGWALFVISMVP